MKKFHKGPYDFYQILGKIFFKNKRTLTGAAPETDPFWPGGVMALQEIRPPPNLDLALPLGEANPNLKTTIASKHAPNGCHIL